MSEERQNRHGDRNDAWLVRDLDPMQAFMNTLMGSRTENEALIEFDVPAENLLSYIKSKNDNNENPVFRYTVLHGVLAAFARTIQMRPKLNYFVRKKKFWERKVISFSFVAKKQKVDGGEENLILTNYEKNSDLSPIEQMHRSTCQMVGEIRESKTKEDPTIGLVSKFLKLPGFIFNTLTALLRHWDKNGTMPKEFAKLNPWNCTCFVSNLGSIDLSATYHHLLNFGTNSIFAILSKITEKPVFKTDGSFELHKFWPIALTVDERIADGVYYAKSVKLLQALLTKPELLDLPANQEIDIDKILAEETN
ncbi:MAG: 2-oxo acid dehydrogenase subunit E2 [Sphaerochaetaceae bacterium]|nr:2-oxo acid dehydrogenase subunit E2 [Sphaerochaetaceae bacterium]